MCCLFSLTVTIEGGGCIKIAITCFIKTAQLESLLYTMDASCDRSARVSP